MSDSPAAEHGPARLSAIVLAGGRSSRMGRDKAALNFDDRSLLARIVDSLRPHFSELIIAPGRQSDRSPAAQIEGVRLAWETTSHEGPLKALRLSLGIAACDCAFVCACDHPFINGELARWLCGMAADHDAAIPVIDGRLQVLHAAYAKSVLPAIDAMITAGEHRLNRIAERIDVRLVDEAETRAWDPELHSFFNLNTPSDYTHALVLSRRAAR